MNSNLPLVFRNLLLHESSLLFILSIKSPKSVIFSLVADKGTYGRTATLYIKLLNKLLFVSDTFAKDYLGFNVVCCHACKTKIDFIVVALSRLALENISNSSA